MDAIRTANHYYSTTFFDSAKEYRNAPAVLLQNVLMAWSTDEKMLLDIPSAKNIASNDQLALNLVDICVDKTLYCILIEIRKEFFDLIG